MFGNRFGGHALGNPTVARDVHEAVFRRRQGGGAVRAAKENDEQEEQEQAEQEEILIGFASGKPLTNLAKYYKHQAKREAEARAKPVRMPNWGDEEGGK